MIRHHQRKFMKLVKVIEPQRNLAMFPKLIISENVNFNEINHVL